MKKLECYCAGFISIGIMTVNLYAGDITKPNTFSTGDIISASKINTNFDILYSTINGGLDSFNIKDDSLGFADLNDLLGLDNTTEIDLGANNLNIDLSSTGDFQILDAGTPIHIFRDDGNVGIGTPDPQNKLHVAQDTSNDDFTTGTIAIGQDGNANYQFRMGYNFLTGVGFRGYLQSYDNGAAAATLINPNGGNVGIGTVTPAYKLDVQTSGTATTQLHVSNSGDSGGYIGSLYGEDVYMSGGAAYNGTDWLAKDDKALITYQGNSSIQFYGDTGLTPGNTFTPTKRMSIGTDGNVGIGNTSPVFAANAKGLDIQGTGGIINNPQDGTERIPTLRLTDTVADYGSATATIGEKRGAIEFYSNETTGNYPAITSAIYTINEDTYNTAHGLAFYTNYISPSPNEKMRIDSLGNVGIGTTDPDSLLTVYSTAAETKATIESNNADGDAILVFENTGVRAWSIGQDDGDSDKFKISNVEGFAGTVMTIDTAGKVGIGTTAPTANLYVVGTSSFTGVMTSLNPGNKVYAVYAPGP